MPKELCVYVHVAETDMAEFIQLLTTYGFTSASELVDDRKTLIAVSLTQKLFVPLYADISGRDTLSVEDFVDLFL